MTHVQCYACPVPHLETGSAYDEQVVSVQKAGFKEGKVPPSVLKSLVFQKLGYSDPSVLVGPSLGIDGAVVDTPKAPIVLSTDPITGASEDLGRLIVNINANDIAVMGAKPRYMTLTLLLPTGFDVNGLSTIMSQVHEECVRLEIAVVGGHTEVTSTVNKPIASATMFGEQIRPISSAGAKLNDRLVLTKGVGMEGTLILLSDCRERITKAGILDNEKIDEAISELKLAVSVVKEALLAIHNNGVNAMHDPTEGGLLNALYEMADASGLGFIIDYDKIHLREDTKKVCEFFKIDPLHLISSGALLLTVDPKHVEELVKTLTDNGIDAAEIGEIVDGARHLIYKDGQKLTATRPVQDALWDALGENKSAE